MALACASAGAPRVNSAPIAQALEMDPDRLRLGGEVREISVFFADIRDFTTFSERHTPDQVVAILNAYYGVVIPRIEAEGGIINQFMGDGIMVLFGAIPDRPDHATAAIRAALSTIRAVEDNQPLWTSLDFDGLRVGIGIHTGPVLLGAVGSPTRLDFTAIGDTVNAASRVEGENKRVGSSILITSATLAAVPPGQRTPLGIREQAVPATVKGKQAELSLHVVECQRTAATVTNQSVLHVQMPGPGLQFQAEKTPTMLLLIVAVTLLPAASDGPEVAAMVLNVQGDVKLRRMDLLRAGALVRVPASGSVRLVFLTDGHREELSPGRRSRSRNREARRPAPSNARRQSCRPVSSMGCGRWLRVPGPEYRGFETSVLLRCRIRRSPNRSF